MNIKINCFFLSVALLLTVISNASAQWVQTNAPDGGVVNCFAASGGNLFVGTNSGIFLSTDSGATWMAVDSGLSSDPYVNALAISAVDPNSGNDSPLLFADLENSDDTNVFLSTNNGTRWNAKTIFYTSFDTVQNTIDTVVDAPDVNVLVVRGPKLYAGTEENGGFFLSTDSGITWMARSNGLPLQSNVTAIMAIGNEIFVGIPGKGVYRSINNGTDWTAAGTGLTSDVTAFALIGSTFFAATGEGVFSTFNNGASWAATNSGLADHNVLTLTIWNGNLFAGTQDSGIFLSTNTGASWIAVNAGLPPNTIVNTFAISGVTTASPILFAAADGGIWMRPVSQMLSSNPFSVVPDSLAFGNVLLGSDSTLTFTIINTGHAPDTIDSTDFDPALGTFSLGAVMLPEIIQPGDSVRFDVTFTPVALGSQVDRLVVSTGSYALSILLNGVGFENASVNKTDKSGVLLQAYPNPFSESTTIQFTTTEQSPVQASIVNVLGEQVALLFDGAMDVGEHSLVWDAKDALAGTYFCEIRSGGGTRQQAAIVLAR